jgi:small subunit ribosomal protein S17
MRSKKGLITSNKQEKTLVVTVHTYKRHPKYLKRYRTSKKYHVDNPENKKFEEGDEVIIYETKPISKLKRWTIVEENAAGVETKQINE